MTINNSLENNIIESVKRSLEEDIGTGDITAQLIPESARAKARVITREFMVLCGRRWAEVVFELVDKSIQLRWHGDDGEHLSADQLIFEAQGPARSILTAERCALNWLQTLSGTATISSTYAKKVAHTNVQLLDTRKTLPGLRLAQKYAVKTGGCHNHRIGLYDAFLIKENHIMASGSIEAAIHAAHQISPNKPIEVEVESMDELHMALQAGADIVMLDNFTLEELRSAVTLAANKPVKLEASGNVNSETLVPIAETGVDYISIGALTKHVEAIDLSMRFDLS